jgi:RNA recognition motif-containing protein
MNIYVGNLSLETTEDDLRQAFAAFGQVRSVNIVRDRDGGESRGFGFVTMPSKSEAQTAIDEMNGKDLKGQAIKTEEGRMKTNLAAGGRKRPGFGSRWSRTRWFWRRQSWWTSLLTIRLHLRSNAKTVFRGSQFLIERS